MAKQKEEVKFISIGELPEDLRTKVMNIHKFICDEANSMFNSAKYDYLKKESWANVKLNDFLTMPNPNDRTKVAIYKRGKRCRCMIQVTAHVTNTRDTENEEFFHGFIRNLHMHVRTKVRRKFDLTLTCESEHGEPFEGFDVWTKQKLAAELWEKASDVKTNTVTPLKESAEDVPHIDYIIAEMAEVPHGLQDFIYEVADYFEEKSHGRLKFDFRFARNKENDKLIKIVYDLNKNMSDHKRPTDAPTHTDAAFVNGLTGKASEFRRLGNTDHNTAGQKVLAIIEYDKDDDLYDGRAGHKLDKVTCYGVFGFNNKKTFSIKVGEIDKEYSYKSTSVPKKSRFVPSSKSPILQAIANNESSPYKRGVSHNGITGINMNPDKLLKIISAVDDDTIEKLRNLTKRIVQKRINSPEFYSQLCNTSIKSMRKFASYDELFDIAFLPKYISQYCQRFKGKEPTPENRKELLSFFHSNNQSWVPREFASSFGYIIKNVDQLTTKVDEFNPDKFKESFDYDITLRCGMNAMYEGSVYLGTYDRDDPIFEDIEEYAEYIENTFPTKYIDIEESSDGIDVFVKFDPEYAKVLYSYLDI